MQQQRQMPARQQHRQTRLSSLSRVLHVTPAQAQAMIDAYPSLRNYNHSFLSRKLQEVSQLLQVPPQQLGPALTQAPKVLGFSLHELEKRLAALTWIQPDRQLLSQVGGMCCVVVVCRLMCMSVVLPTSRLTSEQGLS